MAVVSPLLLPELLLPVLVAFIFAMRYDPSRLHARFTGRFAGGIVLIGLWNLLLPWQLIAINPLSIALSGWLGLPGTALTALLGLV